MSIAARLALALVALAIVAGGVVIFYVLPQLETAETAPPAPAAPPADAKPETVAGATPAPANPAPPPDNGAAQTPPPAGGDTALPPNPAPSDQAPPADQPPAAQPVPPSPGAPIPLAPASAAPAVPDQAPPNQAAAAAPFDPALPGVGNVAAPVNRSLVMAGTADARTEPRADAPVLVRLDKGSPIAVTAVMAGQLWLQVELSDHQTAYIPAAALPQAVAAAGSGSAANTAPTPASAQPSFMADTEFLTATSRAPIYAAPDPAATIQGVLPAGTKVQIVAKSTDGQWGWLQTADGNPAYVKMSALSGAPAPAGAAPLPGAPLPGTPLPDTIAGRAKVLTTASLIVDGHKIELYGIKGMGGAYASQMRAMIESRGGRLSCARRDTLYVCSLPGNLDIARAALYNGAAHPTDDASPDYREQADSARAARRGVWAR